MLILLSRIRRKIAALKLLLAQDRLDSARRALTDAEAEAARAFHAHAAQLRARAEANRRYEAASWAVERAERMRAFEM
jgi:hypothetical protein